MRERIVTEPVAPIVRERVVTGELDAYAYGDGYAYSNGYGYRDPYAYRDGYARDAYAYEPRYQRRYVVSRMPTAPMPMSSARACRSKPGWRRSRLH